MEAKQFLTVGLFLALGVTLFIGNSLNPNNARAEENGMDAIVQRIKDFSDKGNYVAALKETQWLVKDLEKRHFKATEQFLPEKVAGFDCGSVKTTSAMGFSTLERTCSKNSQQLKLTLSGGAAGSTGMAGFSALGKMALMAGGGSDTDAIRIDGKAAQLKQMGTRHELTMFLDAGSILKLEVNGSKDGSELKTFAEALEVSKLDQYLQGQIPAKS